MQVAQTFIDPVFFVPGLNGLCPIIVDMALLQPDGRYVSRYSEKSHLDLSLEYPGLEVGELDDVITAKEDVYRGAPPREITAESFTQALEVLPPENWTRDGLEESFLMCERTSGRITSIFARLADRYFTFSDLYSLNHFEIMAKVRSANAAGTVIPLDAADPTIGRPT